jgi:hypothetical protein
MPRPLARLAAALALAVALLAGTAEAQSAGRTLLGSTAGALIGGFAGALSGASMASDDPACQGGDPDGCLGAQIPKAMWGTGIGITVGAPLGAHFGNRQQGRLALTLLASGALFAGELVALNALVDDGRTEHKNAVFAIAIGVPVLQVIATTWAERAAARR